MYYSLKSSWENRVKVHINDVSFQFFYKIGLFRETWAGFFLKKKKFECRNKIVSSKIFIAWSWTGRVNVPFAMLSECNFLTIRVSCFWVRENKIIHAKVWLYCIYSNALKEQFRKCWLSCIYSSIFYFLYICTQCLTNSAL